jgi:hypothetical protein
LSFRLSDHGDQEERSPAQVAPAWEQARRLADRAVALIQGQGSLGLDRQALLEQEALNACIEAVCDTEATDGPV